MHGPKCAPQIQDGEQLPSFWYRLIQVVLEKRPLKWLSSSSSSSSLLSPMPLSSSLDNNKICKTQKIRHYFVALTFVITTVSIFSTVAKFAIAHSRTSFRKSLVSRRPISVGCGQLLQMAAKCLTLNISATCEIVTWHQQTTNRKGHLWFQWSCDQWRHVTSRGQTRDPVILTLNISAMVWDRDMRNGVNGWPI